MPPTAEPPVKPVAPPVAVPPPEPQALPPPDPSEPNPFAEIDAAIERVEPSMRPPKPEEPAKESPKATPELKATPKVDDKSKTGPKESFAEIRKQLTEKETELNDLRKSRTELEAKIKDYESKGKDTTVLTERLSTMEKELDTVRGQNKMLRFETSDEFRRDFEEPIERLATKAESIINKIQIRDETGAVIRNASWSSDFAKFYQLDEVAASETAEQTFGPKGAQIAMKYYNDLHALQERRNEKLSAEQKNWKESVQKEEAAAITRRDGEQQARQRVRSDLAERDSTYRDEPDDKESLELRNRGYAVFDKEPASPAHRIVKEEAQRHIVAAHGPLKLKVARLEAKLKKYEEAEKVKEEVPGKSKRGGDGGGAAKTDKSWEDEARESVTD